LPCISRFETNAFQCVTDRRDRASPEQRRGFGQLNRSVLIGVVLLSRIITADAARDVPIYGATDGGPSKLLSNADGRSPYRGIVRYLGRAQCTGVFVATARPGDDPDDAPAYVLTNGHCPECRRQRRRSPARRPATAAFFSA
jgi:hypothetical protein